MAEALRNAEGLQETLRELGNGTVALYTVVTAEKFHVILYTPEAPPVARLYLIRAADLNRKVEQFREVLQNPRLDPAALAQELYKIVVGPVAKDLKDAGAKTLMWSLDGTLRYLPIAALHDGEHYMVETYNSTVFTPVSQSRLEKPPALKWQGLGLGVSKGNTPLKFVAEELRGIIQDDTDSASAEGIITGKILLDESFTKEAMKDALRLGRGYPLVHIASHFRFKPGNEYDSYLLLGGQEQESDNKRQLRLSEIKSGEIQFKGVELLTLSACNTAVGGSEGAEIENFAVLAQLRGARAVIATLWPVEDRSTMKLMRLFYSFRNETPTESKIDALTRAQLALLRGVANTPEMLLSKREEASGEQADEPKVPSFKTNRSAPYAHPYFWASFMLIGNWR